MSQVCCLLAAAVIAPAGPTETVDAILKDYQARVQELSNEYRAAKTNEERDRIRRTYAQVPGQFLGRFEKIPQANGMEKAIPLFQTESGAQPFLREVLRTNPHREAKGLACFVLGKQLGDGNPQQQEEAQGLFTRVQKEFSELPYGRTTLGPAAERELYALKYLAIGKVAPEIEGVDLHGQPFTLSSFRGKVVVLDFWGDW